MGRRRGGGKVKEESLGGEGGAGWCGRLKGGGEGMGHIWYQGPKDEFLLEYYGKRGEDMIHFPQIYCSLSST